MAPDALAQLVEVDVEHHHHEEEEHHHRAHVHEHQGDGEELRVEEEPEVRGGEEGEHEPERRVHGVARRDDAQGRDDQDRGAHVEGDERDRHRNLASSARSAAICAS